MVDQLYGNLIPASREIDQIYTFEELNLPIEGIEFSSGGNSYHRPYMIFNMVSSVDGKATTYKGELTGLGSRSDRRLMTRLRSQVDAAIVGGGTLRVDPFIPSVPDDLIAERLTNFANPQPLGIVVSNSGNLPLDHRFWDAGKALRLVFLSESASDSAAYDLKDKAQVVRVPTTSKEGLDLAKMLNMLWQDFGVKRLLVEGGASLNYNLISQGWSDEVFLTLSPRLVGGACNSSIVAGEGFGMFPSLPNLKLRSLYHHDDEIFLRYQVLN
jgi:2,5-diamino-6-(ribosylamino)-4(3H)-pyrimidinone 5'-phosphate reductase